MTIYVKQTDPVTAQPSARAFDGMTLDEVNASMAATNGAAFAVVTEAEYLATLAEIEAGRAT